MDSVRVFGLSRLDSLDLKSRFPDAAITFEPKATEDPQHGELTTAALVAVTVAGIQALAAWLLMHRKNSRIEQTVGIAGPDGTRRTESSSSKHPNARVKRILSRRWQSSSPSI